MELLSKGADSPVRVALVAAGMNNIPQGAFDIELSFSKSGNYELGFRYWGDNGELIISNVPLSDSKLMSREGKANTLKRAGIKVVEGS